MADNRRPDGRLGRELTDDEIRAAVEAYHEHGSYRKAADALGIPKTNFRRRMTKAAQMGMLPTDPVMPGFEITRVSSQRGADGKISREYITQRPERGDSRFELPKGHILKGVSALVDSNGRKMAEWIKTREGFELSIEEIRAAFQEFEWHPVKITPPEQTDADLLTIYPIADLHLALRATADETGEDWNLDIATEVFEREAARLFDQSPPSHTALILWLGDITHQDDDKNVTPRGSNTVEVSDTYFDTVRRSIDLGIAHCLRALEQHQSVMVKVVRGNHDLTAFMGLLVGLEQYFREDERVTVDTGGADYWFFRWGKCLIGAHHGHRLSAEQMAASMAVECAQDWGETLYRLFLHGHLHHQKRKDIHGVLVECLRTLIPADQYHAGKYGAPRSLVSITLHREHGEVGRSQVNVKPIIRRATQHGI